MTWENVETTSIPVPWPNTGDASLLMSYVRRLGWRLEVTRCQAQDIVPFRFRAYHLSEAAKPEEERAYTVDQHDIKRTISLIHYHMNEQRLAVGIEPGPFASKAPKRKLRP